MEAIIDYLLKSAGVLSIFVLIYHFLLRRLTFFNANRWFLLAGIASSILFPLVEITQTVYVEQPEQILYMPQQLATPMAMVLEQPPVEVAAFDYSMLAIYLYLAIVLFFLSKMIVELSSLRSLILSGTQRRVGKFVYVSLSRKLTPFSFFNYICYSAIEQQSPELDLIIDHEKVHAREWHSIDLLVSHVFRAFFWINPLVWLLKKQIGENLEFIADSKAKIQNKSGISYERTLLSTAACHMQPALANNFFTPFIKKRILMLQKEASARWNVYKYALILPVIVLFLYSFNVVEEIEYVKNFKSEISNSETAFANSKELIFDITSATTDDQLESYRKQIESQVNYKLRYEDLKRNNNGRLTTFSLAIKYSDSDWIKDFIVELDDNSSFNLKVKENELVLNVPKYYMDLVIDRSKIKQGYDAISMVSLKTESTSSLNSNKVNFLEDHTISFKIDATSTKEDLIAMKKLFKEEYDIKFDYSKLKFKNDMIIRLKLSLDDNKGYKASKSDSDIDGIDPICVTAVIKGDVAKWNMGSCDENATNSYTWSSTSTYNKSFHMDSLQNQVQLRLQDFNGTNDSLNSVIKVFEYIVMNSLEGRFPGQLKRLDSVRFDIKNIRFTDPQTIYTFKKGISNLPTTKVQLRRGLQLDGEEQPLFIIDGREATQDEIYKIEAENIESVTVLKNNDATSLYGDKAVNGVVLIVTDFSKNKARAYDLRSKENAQRKGLLEKQEQLKSQYQQRKDSLDNKRAILLEGERAKIESKKEAMMLKRDTLKLAKSIDQRTENRLVYGYPKKGIDSEFILKDVSKEGFEKLQKDLEEAGHTFKLKTHRMKDDRLMKLKYEIDGQQYTYQTNNGVKELKIQFVKGSKTPSISMIPY